MGDKYSVGEDNLILDELLTFHQAKESSLR